MDERVFVLPLQTESPPTCSQDGAQEPVGQSTSIRPCCDVAQVTVLAQNWCSPFTAFSYLSKELAIQLAKHSRVEVSLLVPHKSMSEEDKQYVCSCGISIVEARAHPGFPDPIDWLYFPPNDFLTHMVVALDDNLGKIAHVLKEHRQCKRIQMVYSLSKETGTFSSRFYDVSKEIGKFSSSKRKHQTNVGLCEGADLVVGLGPKIVDELTASLRYCKKQVVNLTPGIFSELPDLNHAKEDGKIFRILVLSENDPAEYCHDRFHIATKAVSLLRDKTFHLVFIGVQGDKRSEFLEHCCQYGAAKQQLITKSLPESEEDLKRLFCEVDLAILLSTEEEYGLIALGALSAGLPVCVCGDSGFAEALREVPFGTDSIVDSENADEWANSIRKVRETDRKTRLEQAAVLRSHFEETYNWKKQFEGLVEKMFAMCQGMCTILKGATHLCDLIIFIATCHSPLRHAMPLSLVNKKVITP